MYSPNERIQIHYPETSLINSRPKWKLREIIVRKTRDLVTDPLSIEDYLRRPLIHRGRWLIMGTDSQNGKLRQFYLSTTREQYRPVPLRVGVYEADSKRPAQILFRPFEPTVRDRIVLSRLVTRFAGVSHSEKRIGVFADDLRVV